MFRWPDTRQLGKHLRHSRIRDTPAEGGSASGNGCCCRCLSLELMPQGIAPAVRNPDRKKVPRRERPRADRRRHQTVEVAHPGAIALGQQAAPLVPGVEKAQLNRQHGCLDRVEAGVEALDDMPVSLRCTVNWHACVLFGSAPRYSRPPHQRRRALRDSLKKRRGVNPN
jgi:hypothetical protein